MNSNDKVKKITGISILTAIVIILQLFFNLAPSLGLNIPFTLALVPIAIGAILYGPLTGFFLGFIDGFIIIFAPSTLSTFFSLHPIYTIIVCLAKTSLAGLASGFVYKLFKKHLKIGSLMASITVPIVNTGLFSILCLILFNDLLSMCINESTANVYSVLFITFIGTNFFIELSVNALLSTVVYTIIKYRKR